KKTQFELDNLLAESNQLSKQIGELYKNGQAEKANQLKAETSSLKDKSKKLQETLNQYKVDLEEMLFQIPNALHSDVVAGKGEEDNMVVLTHGEPIEKEGLPHWELATKYDLIDFELGTKITGAGFPVYKGKGARLQRALINFFLDKNTN